MKIALCASEVVPFAKTGGLADVCGALPLELEDLGHEVIIIMPKYQSVRPSGALIKRFNEDFDVTAIGEKACVYFLKHDMYLRAGLYGDEYGDYPDNLKRFSYFCSKALELFGKIDFKPDILHCNDWQTALIPMFTKIYKERYFPKGTKVPKSLLTIHNVSYQGLFPREAMPETGLGWEHFSLFGLEFYDKLNLLKGGIQYADIVNTVSVTHAREIQTKEFGCGMEGVLSAKKDKFLGITNGIDYKVWNPQGDPNIFKNYSSDNIEERAINKLKLQALCGLVSGEKVPLFGFVGRLVEQKGIDLILKVLPKLCAVGAQAIFLGKGEPKYEAALLEMVKAYPGLCFFSSKFDDILAHRIYAASDFFLMPSAFEPCGIGQMISFKYGAVPIVYKTGGLADTVIDYDLKSHKGNGFVFTKHTVPEFELACMRALECFANAKKLFELKKRIMRLNFSWKESAKKYVELYEKAIKA